MVMRRCRSLLKDEEEAADAMQDTFVRLLRHKDRLEERGPSSLLYTIATNVCLNRMRSVRRDKSDAAGEALERIAVDSDHEEQVLAGHFLEQLFREQKDDTRTMAICHYLYGMTLEETARLCDMSVSGVRKRLRGLRRDARKLHVA
jgi:RNA polymerase sigma-70 factor (ECF subfamily)